MASRPFRFVQASDFHLHQPPHGLADVPDHLAEVLLEAPYRATAGVFDVALAEEVDFVLLTGSLVDPRRAGPRGMIFLAEQFARLAERGIAVYWATGSTSRSGDWPESMHWPSNLRILSTDHAAGHFGHRIHSRADEPICEIDCRTADDNAPNSRFGAGISDLFSLVVSPPASDINPANLDITRLDRFNVDYWAFGGLPDAATPRLDSGTNPVAHCAGSPQGRAPGQTGPHGCTVVRVDAAREILLAPVATDAIRWHQERVVVAPDLQRPDLERLLHQRMQTLISTAPDRTHLVRWTLAGASPLMARARQSGLAAEWLARLRAEYGSRSPAAWSISLEVEPPDALPENCYQQQTLLGDYLRAIRALAAPGVTGPDLEPLIPAAWAENGLSARGANSFVAEFLRFDGPAARSAVLRQAAIVGAELLRPDEFDLEGPSP